MHRPSVHPCRLQPHRAGGSSPPGRLLYPRAARPSFGSRGQSREAARCRPSGLQGRNTRWVSLCGGVLRAGRLEAGPGPAAGHRVRLGSTVGVRPRRDPRGQRPVSPGGGCCSPWEAEGGKGTYLINYHLPMHRGGT